MIKYVVDIFIRVLPTIYWGMTCDFYIGDLVEIMWIGEGTAVFPWTETPVPGIYLGTMEFTHYIGPEEKVKDVCHKVWSMGKVRYINTIEEISLLSTLGKDRDI